MSINNDTYRKILQEYWGYDDFRGIQREIIENICAGKDTLGLMPTGGGKSITFQVPALASEGVCIVITPLIALMKDQVANLRRKGIKASAVYSGMSHSDIMKTLDNAIFGGVKILYISPERLSSELFIQKLKHMSVSLITVDEAHCISQWGYDFRPSYLHISQIRKTKPEAPLLALTATATPPVVDDIQDKLGFKNKNVFKMSFERKNLAYIVRKTFDKEKELTDILQKEDGCAIVYVRNRQKSKDIAQLLNRNGISATFYNAGLENAVRDERQKEWTTDQVRVMVATNAFGMGIDKPDVRLVIHTDCPDSIEAYFQEAGRAGRDGKMSKAILLYNGNDKGKLTRRIDDSFPEPEYIRTVYDHLAFFYQIAVGSGSGYRFEFNIDKFCQTFKHFPTKVHSALKILMRSGYIDYEDEDEGKTRVKILLGRESLYRLDTLSEKENNIITALLRNYGGLFVDMCAIDESLIAMQTGLGRQEIYDIMKHLAEIRIITFIPRKKIPHIIYLQRREESERLVFPDEVYKERKKEFTQRINSMINYASNNDICRSRQLLKYFGEKSSKNCGQCDICINHNKKEPSKAEFEKACAMITQLLNDKKPHHITEINTLEYDRDTLEDALEYLIDEEKVFIINGNISI
ncbi:MAG: RecQ family ATP-dependent DNA helicase [Prevotella sp.]